MHMIIISTALTALAVILWRKSLRSTAVIFIASASVFISLLLLGTYYFIDRLTGSGIDESIFFHLSVGLTGAGVSDFSGWIIQAVLYVLVIIALSTLLLRFFRSSNTIHIVWALAGSVAVSVSLATNPTTLAIFQLAMREDVVTVASPEQYVEVADLDVSTANKNIVILYMESFERTYFDETVFPNLTPNLKALEDRALSFTNIGQAWGTSWTISGMIASQCGLPLVGVFGNSMSQVDQFLPNATCISDLLAREGYGFNYLGGANLDFAGKGVFLATHSFAKIEGLAELQSELTDPERQAAWGMYDDSLYPIIYDRLNRLLDADTPFGLVILTLDTHHPNGYVAEACRDEPYLDGSNPILNSVHCSDKMAGEFIRNILDSGILKDTILVVASDHLAMPNTARDQLNSIERNNMVMVFGDDITPQRVEKPGTMLDLAPTLLNLMGANVAAFGFGRDLLAEEPTLREGEQPLDNLLAGSRGFLTALWSFPQLDDGLRLDAVAERLWLGERHIGLPALLLLDDGDEVTEINFEFYNDLTLAEQIAGLAPGQRFLWVDKCGAIGVDNAGEDYCAALGATGGADMGVLVLMDGARISATDFVVMP